MAKTKQEIEEWLKVFYQRQIKRLEEDEMEKDSEYYVDEDGSVSTSYSNFIIYVPEAILDLLPDWEYGWEGCDWVMDSSGIGLLGVEGEEYADEDAKEEYGVDSVDDLNSCHYKQFYCMKQSEIDWWYELGSQIKGKTGLPFEEVVIEEGDVDAEDDPELELKNLKNRLKGEKANIERIKEEMSQTDEKVLIEGMEALIENRKETIVYLEDAIKKLEG